MELPEHFLLERRPIKHARLRVSEDLHVRVVVPEDFNEEDISTLLRQKDGWIRQKLRYFEDRPGKLHLRNNQVFYLGERYSYFFERELGRHVIVNSQFKTIRSGKNLLDEQIQKKWLRTEAQKLILGRVEAKSEETGLNYGRIFIRNALKKWGNCSSQKNLSFNWRLIKTPLYVVDYLISHELVHTRFMNHGREFWRKLRAICPESTKAQEWLETHGHLL